MALQASVACRNSILDSIETTFGASPILKIRSGAVPATCATADSGTVGVTINCPADAMAAAASGSKAKLGTWQDASADNSITAGHWRLYDSGGSTVVLQGTVTATGGGGDMTIDSTTITAAQSITVTTFTLSAANS